MNDAAPEPTPYLTYLGLDLRADSTVVLPGDARHAGDPGATFLHGGVVAAFLEATALLHLRNGGVEARIIDFTSSFIRPSSVSDTYASARVLSLGRRFSAVSVTAWQEDPARPVALGQGTFRVRR